MTTNNTEMNPIGRVEIGNEVELNQETLEQMSGGAGPRCGMPPKRVRRTTKREKPEEGGATLSW